ncbi:MAG TPA: glutamine amidotransferase [Blastocatellia bacterium]
MEQVVSFLFKYRGSIFSKGHLVVGIRPPVLLIIVVTILIGCLIYFLYSRERRLPVLTRWMLASLRLGLITLILMLLIRPAIVIPSVVPQSMFVAVLMDDSASMKIADQGGRTRLDAIKDLMAPESALYSSLADKFKVKMYKFSSGAEPIVSPAELSGSGQQTNIALTLDQATRDLGGMDVAGVVLMTDGAQNSSADMATTLGNLRSRGIPVFTVGVGSTDMKGDVELSSASAPRRSLIGSSVSAELSLKASGIKDRVVKINVTEDGHPLKSQDVPLATGDSTQVVRIAFTPTTPGVHRYSFTAPPLPGEPVTDNNTQEMVIDVEDAHPRILYVEGEPRWEYGKIRGGMAEEKNVVLVSLLRSADGKFYRQGVDSGDELSSGFPKSEQELFKYDAIMLGSVEATFFTFEQLRAIEQFVSRRGGGLLMLGGARSFDGGDYLNTPMADLLPVSLTGQSPKDWESQIFKAEPSDRGRDNPVCRLADGAEANDRAWAALPAITIPDQLSGVKPGATVILQARGTRDRSRVLPLLLEERYGRGRTLAFLASDTWRWRMMLESKDQSFETFWHNLLRYTVQSVRRPVEVSTSRQYYATGEPVQIRAEVADNLYNNVTDARVQARVTSPSGKSFDVELKPHVQDDFDGYSATLPAGEEGTYRIDVTAEGPKGVKTDLPSTTATTEFLVGQIDREAFGAAQNRDLLKQISAETGGSYYSPDTAANLADDISLTDNASSVRQTKDLWDMPVNFMLLIGLASAEWFVRKRSGLA